MNDGTDSPPPPTRTTPPPIPFPTQLDQDEVLPEHLNRHPVYKKLHFQDGLGPYPIYNANPSFVECAKDFNNYELGLIAMATVGPAFIGLNGGRGSKAWIIGSGIVGLGVGLGFAYMHAFSRLAGFKPYE